jgi:hypothetical protein
MSEKQKPIVILKMKDKAESKRVKKEQTFDLPMRVLIVGKSQYAGKTNAVGNFLTRPFNDHDEEGKAFYARDFLSKNIYIVCPSTDLDSKWQDLIEAREIPASNVFTSYDEETMDELYEALQKQYKAREQNGDPHEHVLLILDDLAFSGKLKDKMHGVLAKIFCNGRQILISVIATMQKYSQVSTTARENATGLLLYECSNKQLELIMDDHAIIPKKDFIKVFRDATKEKHSFMVVNYSNDYKDRYQNSHFQTIAVL